MNFLKNISITELAKRISEHEKYFAFLYSGVETNYSGKTSILAFGLDELINEDSFKTLEDKLKFGTNEKWQNFWIGYLGYDLKNQIEKFTAEKPAFIESKNLCFFKPKTILVYNHDSEEFSLKRGNEEDLKTFLKNDQSADFGLSKIKYFKSNFSTQEYLDKVSEIKDLISAGIIYQANLTRKFYGEFESEPNGFNYFTELCKKSPAPYSAYFKLDNLEIISSSPEQFVKIDDNKNAETRPIKGTSAKSLNNQELAHSLKDQSENLMITDLMRNDFSRICKNGSVKVENLFEVAEFKTLNHMQSTIKGKIADDKTSLDLIKACFPPGSMTGAPKIKAIEVCSALEDCSRGIYSGALGYIDGSGSVELSVIIRTIIIEGKKFETQVGGGIVYDSNPQSELEETYTKIKPIAEILGFFDDLTKKSL